MKLLAYIVVFAVLFSIIAICVDASTTRTYTESILHSFSSTFTLYRNIPAGTMWFAEDNTMEWDNGIAKRASYTLRNLGQTNKQVDLIIHNSNGDAISGTNTCGGVQASLKTSAGFYVWQNRQAIDSYNYGTVYDPNGIDILDMIAINIHQ
jgi:hypothetical protein